MTDDTPAALGALRVDEGKLRSHVDEVVRSSVEETLNGLLDAEANRICRAQRYEHSPERLDTRAGHYERTLETKAGEVTLRMPKLRRLPFETAIIERYRRREASVEIIREIRRRTRVVGAFPDGHSALMLVAARLRHIASSKWGKRRYMLMEPLLNPAKQEAAA
jgi:transposase-like protein